MRVGQGVDCLRNLSQLRLVLNEYLDTIASLVTALAAVWAAAAATTGLNVWKTQLRGNAEYETARRALRAALAVRQNVRYVRAPFIPVGEIVTAFNNAGIDPTTVKIPGDERTDHLVYQARWKPVAEAMLTLEAELLEAEVLWGKELQSAFDQLRRMASKLLFAIEHHVRRRATHPYPEPAMTEFDIEQMGILYSGQEDDQFARELDEGVNRLTSLLRPRLHRRV